MFNRKYEQKSESIKKINEMLFKCVRTQFFMNKTFCKIK